MKLTVEALQVERDNFEYFLETAVAKIDQLDLQPLSIPRIKKKQKNFC